MLRAFFERYGREIGVFVFIGGFFFDTFTLPPVDRTSSHLVIGLYLLAVAGGIALLKIKPDLRLSGAIQTLIHFGFGGLWSALFVFYFRSATLAGSWIFLVLLGSVFFATEKLRDHYRTFVLQASALYATLFLFLLFYIPVLVGKMDILTFIGAGITSAFIVLGGIVILGHKNDKNGQELRFVAFVVVGIFLLLSGLFASGAIPPIPLALAHIGVYHKVERLNGNPPSYITTSEGSARWYDRLLGIARIYHRTPGESVTVASTIVVPARITVKILHHWQYKDEANGKWITEGHIPLSLAGGRLEGYRTWSEKSALRPGRWRVDAETQTGAVIGRIEFIIVDGEPPHLETEPLY